MAFAHRVSCGVNRLASTFGRFAKRCHSSWALSEEDLARYCRGGYHPVRIGDVFKDNKYRSVTKLGYGGYSTVWLVCDLESVSCHTILGF